MPAENNNPWSGELKAKRQKSRESNKGKNNSETVTPKTIPQLSPRHPNPEKDSGITSSKIKNPVSANNSDEKETKIVNKNAENDTALNPTPIKQTNDDGVNTPDESTENMLKFTRKNLRPVGQPFKRADSLINNENGETVVDSLLRQSSNSTEYSENRNACVKGSQVTNSPSSGEGKLIIFRS